MVNLQEIIKTDLCYKTNSKNLDNFHKYSLPIVF